MATQTRESGPGKAPDVPFAANAVRLTGRQWLVVFAVVGALFWAFPAAWERLETFEPDPDFRVPDELSEDYGLFRRAARLAAAERKLLLIGDSVVWGRHVGRDQTLSHHLNALLGQRRVANLGVNGMNPAVLAGLIDLYGQPIRGQDVILHWNLLWISSPDADLQGTKGYPFNHPDLLPQLTTRIPGYKESWSARIGIAVSHRLPIAVWARHIRVACFGGIDIPNWTIENPYACPARQISLDVAIETEGEGKDQVPWRRRGIARQELPWVGLETSIQWRFLRQALATLQRRGNRVFVLVGPFNEHMLEPESRAVYQERKRQVAAWLAEHGVAPPAPPPPPRPLYGDASHPLAEGYALLARQLVGSESFARFADGSTQEPPQ